jgi:hypothetical protein
MKVVLSERAIESLQDVPVSWWITSCIRRCTPRNTTKPTTLAGSSEQDWRFYFTIAKDTYRIEKIIPHAK